MATRPNKPPVRPLPDGADASLVEIGLALGVSHQRAAQLLHDALRHARAVCEERGIDPRAFFDRLTVDSSRCRVETSTIEIEHRPRAPGGQRRAGA